MYFMNGRPSTVRNTGLCTDQAFEAGILPRIDRDLLYLDLLDSALSTPDMHHVASLHLGLF